MENVQLVIDIYAVQPDVPPALTEAAQSFNAIKHDPEKLAAMCSHAILPACFRRENMKLALKAS